jgi:hypothetical protein
MTYLLYLQLLTNLQSLILFEKNKFKKKMSFKNLKFYLYKTQPVITQLISQYLLQCDVLI